MLQFPVGVHREGSTSLSRVIEDIIFSSFFLEFQLLRGCWKSIETSASRFVSCYFCLCKWWWVIKTKEDERKKKKEDKIRKQEIPDDPNILDGLFPKLLKNTSFEEIRLKIYEEIKHDWRTLRFKETVLPFLPKS